MLRTLAQINEQSQNKKRYTCEILLKNREVLLYYLIDFVVIVNIFGCSVFGATSNISPMFVSKKSTSKTFQLICRVCEM